MQYPRLPVALCTLVQGVPYRQVTYVWPLVTPLVSADVATVDEARGGWGGLLSSSEDVHGLSSSLSSSPPFISLSLCTASALAAALASASAAVVSDAQRDVLSSLAIRALISAALRRRNCSRSICAFRTRTFATRRCADRRRTCD